MNRRLGDRDLDPRRAIVAADRQRDRQDAVRQHRFRASAPHRFRQIDLPVRCPDRPLVLQVVLLFLRVTGFGFDDQPTAVKADRYGVVMRPRDRDCDRDLVARLVHVNGGRLDRGLVRHHVQA